MIVSYGAGDGNQTHLRSLGKGRSNYLTRPTLRLLPFCGRVHFLVHPWSNNCYLGFQSEVLVAIRAA